MEAIIQLPDLGLGFARLSLWLVDAGDRVFEGDRVVEILVNGATFDVAAPASGRLREKLALPDDPIKPGQALGVLDLEAQD